MPIGVADPTVSQQGSSEDVDDLDSNILSGPTAFQQGRSGDVDG